MLKYGRRNVIWTARKRVTCRTTAGKMQPSDDIMSGVSTAASALYLRPWRAQGSASV